MNTQIQIFKNSQFGEVRVTEIDGKTYFVGIDVAKALGYQNANDAVARHCKGCVKHAVLDNNGVTQMMNVIPESDVYRLILRSNTERAEKFQEWVCGEVLPSIHGHGGYLTAQKIEEALLNPDTLIQLATNLKDERQKRVEAEKQLEVAAPKVEYYDKVLGNKQHTLLTIQIAKEFGMSDKALNIILYHLDVQYKRNGQWLLTHPYADKGYVDTKTTYIEDEYNTITKVSTVWTHSGRRFIHGLIDPLIESGRLERIGAYWYMDGFKIRICGAA
jgi:prophage antirepressor-like protein